MKTCPACASRYSDDTLQFCLQDGARLYSADEAAAPTAVLNEIETAEARKPLPPTTPADWHAPATQKSRPASGSRRKIAIAVVLTALGMLLLVGGAALGVWLYSRQPRTEIAVNTSPGPSPNTRATATPRPSTPTPSPSATAQTKPPANEAEIREDVLDRLETWTSDTEAGDIDACMSNYAPTVDYYGRGPSSASYIRGDKQRAFSRYSSIELNLSNIAVTPAADGESATVIFDKEWNFSGDGTSTGKVQQMLRLKKIGGEWLITAEKDLKDYNKR
ncbi:MAG TPA: hypothetical protein VNA17_04490 [Pyrinomonadaceae bacterium]|nr:hypothetical protein [Pyrinomonadaceae bacterium]